MLLWFVVRASLYSLFQMEPSRCSLILGIFISTSLHVSGNYVSIIRRTYFIWATLLFFTLYGWLSGLLTRQPPVQSEKYQCRILTYLLTYSMVQSPSWEPNWFAASQEFHLISRNPKVHYRTHKRPPPVSILGQSNPAHIPTSYLLEIHPTIMNPSRPRSPQWSPSLRFPHQDPIHLTHTRHMPSPSHFSRFYHPHIYTAISPVDGHIFDRNM